MNRHPELSFAGSLKSEPRRTFYEHHKPVAVLMILILFLFPIVGVFVMGVPGAVLGVAISVLGYYLAPYVVPKLPLS
jgi:hypothetical protein